MKEDDIAIIKKQKAIKMLALLAIIYVLIIITAIFFLLKRSSDITQAGETDPGPKILAPLNKDQNTTEFTTTKLPINSNQEGSGTSD